ncbi:4Fe-4S ferredoxin [bacterium]|nr:4Fe-4S ferredoxin [bacterium]
MKRLFIDLEVCFNCKECTAVCSYFFHPENKGVLSLLELASRAHICRNCETAPCVTCCPKEALEKQEDGVLKRYSMRCTSCKCCTIACPFGVIYPELVPYLVSKCDFCLQENAEPPCVKGCPDGAVKYLEVEESKEKNIYFIGDHLAIHATPWMKEVK